MNSVNVKYIRNGDRLHEYVRGRYLPLTATEDAGRVENREGYADGWECRCTSDDTGESVHLFASDGGSAYAPQLFRRTDTDET